MAKKQKKTGCVFDMFHKEKVCDIQKTLEEYVDPMDRFRPGKNKAKDYTLNQTFAIMDKGPVKIRYTDTNAEYDWYPPGYEPKEKKRKEYGRGPLKWFLDEVWGRVVEKQQLKIKQSNAMKFLAAENARIAEIQETKAYVKKKVGPDWYQELSRKQCTVVDQLYLSIVIDYKRKSILCTRENLNDLGVKCKRSVIKFALKECCFCPSELLLIVYQLINPNRKHYSITDRLLLSSVVHLSMKQTLRELHVRIPSPPRKRRVRRPFKEEDRGTCTSPYLDKYIYSPRPIFRKWEKPEKEFPKNEYFSYLQELRRTTIWIYAEEKLSVPKFDLSNMPEDCYTCALIETELNLIKEWVYAQSIYNTLTKSKLVPALHKASVYPICLREPAPKTISETSEEVSEDVVDESESDSGDDEPPGFCGMAGCAYAKGKDYCKGDDELSEEEETESGSGKDSGGDECRKESGNECRKEGPAVKIDKSGVCRCKELILKKVEDAKCKCEECAEDRLKNESSNADKICNCMEKYLQKCQRHEKWVDLMRIQDQLKGVKDKFVITGVTAGPDGKPLYILQGVKAKEECACYNSKKYKEEEELREALQAKLPDGCLKYIVAGVCSTPEGNYYILSGVTPNVECDCMQVYDKFMKNHEVCLRLYEAYLKKVEAETSEYFVDNFLQYSQPELDKPVADLEDRDDDGNGNGEDNSDVDGQSTNDASKFLCGSGDDSEKQSSSSSCCSCEYSKPVTSSPCPCSDPKGDACKLVSFSPSAEACQLAKGVIDEEVCTLVRENTNRHNAEEEGGSINSGSMYCTCDQDSKDSRDSDNELDRYVILKEFPKTQADRDKLLKAALAKLADDGFPLALLPDTYKLPHFQIWLKLRAKKFWALEAKKAILTSAKVFCCKIDRAKGKARVPTITFLQDEPEKQNWSHRGLIKKTNDRIMENFYRKAKKVELDYARMFYPITYNYEFPSKSLRDVFYTYMPSKESDIMMYKIWQGYEFRRNSRRKC